MPSGCAAGTITGELRAMWLNLRAFVAGGALALLLSGCTRHGAATMPSQGAIEHAAAATPSDPRIAELYRQSCRACHAVAGSGAPLTGDRQAWDDRWEKGTEALRSSAISGMEGMPAGGQCFACTPQDYDALILFMAGRAQAAVH
jgi:cytochrome c5